MRDGSNNTVTRLDVVILGGLSGRMDQTMHTLHVLCQLAPTSQEEQEESKDNVPSTRKNKGLDEEDFVTLDRRPRAWVMSENSLTWILNTVGGSGREAESTISSLKVLFFSQGKHLITIDQSIFGPTCGLLPLMSQLHDRGHSGTKIWTQGLEWDLGESNPGFTPSVRVRRTHPHSHSNHRRYPFRCWRLSVDEQSSQE